MWCPRCKSEFVETAVHCPDCGVDLVHDEPVAEDSGLDVAPLTGRPIEREPDAAGPVFVGSFVTRDEAQAAVRALADAGIRAEIVDREELFPTTISKYEPALGVTVDAPDSPRARSIVKSVERLWTAMATFRREEEAQSALKALEARRIEGRVVSLVLDEIPKEFREEMEPYTVEVPADREVEAHDLFDEIYRVCDVCGARMPKGDSVCRSCGEPTGR